MFLIFRSFQASAHSLPQVRQNDKALAWTSDLMDSRQRAKIYSEGFVVTSVSREAIFLQIFASRFRPYFRQM